MDMLFGGGMWNYLEMSSLSTDGEEHFRMEQTRRKRKGPRCFWNAKVQWNFKKKQADYVFLENILEEEQ